MAKRDSLGTRIVVACLVLGMYLPANSHAGDAVSERDELDNGPSFFGEAKEAGSLRPMQNVKIVAELGDQKIATYTNDEGSFKIPGFGKDTVADGITITCSKEGYQLLDMSRRQLSSAADAPVVVECLLGPAQ